MQNQHQENQVGSMDSFLGLSFSTYSSNNVNDVAFQVTHENDNSLPQNDNNDFEFIAFRNSPEFDNRHRSTENRENFPIFNCDGRDRRNSDVVENSISLRKQLIGDEKRNLDTSLEVEDDLNAIPRETYCLWTPKSPTNSPISWPIKCKKSNSTGSSSNSCSKRWKFLSLLRRSKSDGKESLMENSKENCGSSDIPKVAGKKILVTAKKIPATVTAKKIPVTVAAIEAFYARKKELRRKSYLPYKQELFGFGRAYPLHA